MDLGLRVRIVSAACKKHSSLIEKRQQDRLISSVSSVCVCVCVDWCAFAAKDFASVSRDKESLKLGTGTTEAVPSLSLSLFLFLYSRLIFTLQSPHTLMSALVHCSLTD